MVIRRYRRLKGKKFKNSAYLIIIFTQLEKPTIFIPKAVGAHSTQRTLPLASLNRVRSTHRSELLPTPEPIPKEPPGVFPTSPIRSHILTVLSKEADAKN